MNEMWDWQSWFAWYPVVIKQRIKWLCCVQRRNTWYIPPDDICQSKIVWEYK